MIKMNESAKKIEEEFIDLFCQPVTKDQKEIEIPFKRIMAILLIEPKPVSIEELAKKTGYSLSMISLKTRTMELLGLIKSVKIPGDRKRYYYAEKDLIKLILERYKKSNNEELVKIERRLKDILEKYKDQKNEKYELVKNYYKQLKILRNAYKKFIKILENATNNKA